MPTSKSNQAIQTIEELQSRYQKFAEQKIKIETRRDHTSQQLQKLRAEALEQFGSDDLDNLKAKLAEMKESNERKRVDYQKKLDQIEQRLVEINEQFVDASPED